jgi:hypothetical protein
VTTTPPSTQKAVSTLEPARWSLAGQFLESLSARDYARMAGTLAEDVRLRALLPTGASEWHGRTDVTETFASWYAGADDFEVVDASVGEVARRLLMTWRIRVRPAPHDDGDGWHLIEQHAFADAGDAIEALDLVCSGFRIDRTIQ